MIIRNLISIIIVYVKMSYYIILPQIVKACKTSLYIFVCVSIPFHTNNMIRCKLIITAQFPVMSHLFVLRPFFLAIISMSNILYI